MATDPGLYTSRAVEGSQKPCLMRPWVREYLSIYATGEGLLLKRPMSGHRSSDRGRRRSLDCCL